MPTMRSAGSTPLGKTQSLVDVQFELYTGQDRWDCAVPRERYGSPASRYNPSGGRDGARYGPLTPWDADLSPVQGRGTCERGRLAEEIAVALGDSGDGDVAGGDALRGAGPLIVGEEEELVAADGTANGAAELVLVEGGAGGIEVAAGVESRCCGRTRMRCRGNDVVPDLLTTVTMPPL